MYSLLWLHAAKEDGEQGARPRLLQSERTPVSYTHLDVYKRQAYFLLLGVLPRTVCMLCGAAVTIAFRFAAVYFGWHLPVLGDKAGRSKP